MERCDENYKIYSRQRTTTKYTRAAANMFSTSKEGVSNAKPYCPSQACTFTASHPGVRTTKTHRRYSLKSLSKLRRFPCCLKAPWSLLFILACATLPVRWVTPWFRTQVPADCILGISKDLLRLPSINQVPVSFDQKFDVAVLVVPPRFNGLYAPFLSFRYCFHALRLQTHSGFGRYALSRPHCKHVSSFANIRKIQIISMEKLMGTMHFDSSVQLRFTTRYLYQVVPEAAVRGVRDAFPCCLVQRLITTNITIAT